eukprot:21770_4
MGLVKAHNLSLQIQMTSLYPSPARERQREQYLATIVLWTLSLENTTLSITTFLVLMECPNASRGWLNGSMTNGSAIKTS